MSRPSHRSSQVAAPVFTALYKRAEGGWVGTVKEVPGVISEADTEQELIENLKSALGEILEIYSEEAEATFRGRGVRHLALA